MKLYESIGIRPPLEEFDRYVRTKIEALTRLGGDSDELAAHLEAFEVGKRLLLEVHQDKGKGDDR